LTSAQAARFGIETFPFLSQDAHETCAALSCRQPRAPATQLAEILLYQETFDRKSRILPRPLQNMPAARAPEISSPPRRLHIDTRRKMLYSEKQFIVNIYAYE
jgi:hypothetical protein